MTEWNACLDTLHRHAKETKRSYYIGIDGVTDEDMRAAARRYLTMRLAFERASGRPVTTTVSPASVARFLRNL